MKEQDVMSDLKIRVGYGVTGQQDIADNDYPWMTTFSVSYPESMYLFGDKWYSLYRPNGYDNDLNGRPPRPGTQVSTTVSSTTESMVASITITARPTT